MILKVAGGLSPRIPLEAIPLTVVPGVNTGFVMVPEKRSPGSVASKTWNMSTRLGVPSALMEKEAPIAFFRLEILKTYRFVSSDTIFCERNVVKKEKSVVA